MDNGLHLIKGKLLQVSAVLISYLLLLWRELLQHLIAQSSSKLTSNTFQGRVGKMIQTAHQKPQARKKKKSDSHILLYKPPSRASRC